MIELTKEKIDEINSKCPYDFGRHEEGIFTQPYGIPVHIKEPVIYSRCEVGGYRGGSCYDTVAKPYTVDEPEDYMKVLDLVMSELSPNISYSKYKGISNLIRTNSETDREYYGNSTDYEIRYIILSELYDYLNKSEN